VALDLDVSGALDVLAEAVRRQQCILFPPAESPFEYGEDERPPFGSDPSRELARSCGLGDRSPETR
jgi:hypothetical protein